MQSVRIGKDGIKLVLVCKWVEAENDLIGLEEILRAIEMFPIIKGLGLHRFVHL